MMRPLKLLGLGLMAILMICLSSFAATAAAEGKPNMLPIGTAARPVSFTISSGKGHLETLAGKKIECEKDTGKGEVTSEKLGTMVVTFEKCKEPEFKTECTGLATGETKGNIKIEGTFHTWYGFLEGKLVNAFVFLLNHTHFSCVSGIALILMLGCLAGEVLEANKLTKTVKIDFKLKGIGDADINEILNEKSEKIKCQLTQGINEPASEESMGWETTEEATGFKQNGVAVEALMMY
jgi:hypothetical protein